MSSPTSRSLDFLRQAGYLADVTERWIAQAGVRRDLFGCIDLVAIHPRETGVLGVQATSLSNVSTRIAKAKGIPALRVWLTAGCRFEVWGWAKRGKRWRVKRIELRGEDLAEQVICSLPRRPGRGHRQGELFG